jgi:hypothetical protein
MWLIRRRLVAVALTVVLCHLGGVSSAVVCQTGAAETSAADAIVCTCDHASGGECPMHKAAHSPAGAASPTTSQFRCCPDDAGGVLTIGYWAGPPVNRLELQTPAPLSVSISSIPAHVLDVNRSPDFPPPRT